MFIESFNSSELTTIVIIPTKRIDDYYSESFRDFLYANLFPLHKNNLESIYVGDEDSRYSEVADVIRCEMCLNKVSVEAVEAIQADLGKITEDWLVSVGGYEAVQP